MRFVCNGSPVGHGCLKCITGRLGHELKFCFQKHERMGEKKRLHRCFCCFRVLRFVNFEEKKEVGKR